MEESVLIMENAKFNLKEYIESSEKIDRYLKPKLKYFLLYLKDEFGEDYLEQPDILAMLDKDYLLNSLEFFIDKTSPSRQTAHDYRRAVIRLIELVCEEFTIENTFLASVAMRAEFNEEAQTRILCLREKTNQDCMSDEEYELLDERITDFLSTDGLFEQVSQSIVNDNKKPNFYSQLVSAIALRLVQTYGLGNNIIANLNTSDLILGDKILYVNGIKLYLNDEIVSAFELYEAARSRVTQIHNCQPDKLFIKKDGTPYLDTNGQADNNGLFFLMESAIGHKKVRSIQYRTIVDLAIKGANIGFLYSITGVKENTIIRVCRENAKELKENFENIFKSANTYRRRERKQKKGLIQCPYCGTFKEACAENWILIQVDGEEQKHLSCKECGGCDGKYHY